MGSWINSRAEWEVRGKTWPSILEGGVEKATREKNGRNIF